MVISVYMIYVVSETLVIAGHIVDQTAYDHGNSKAKYCNLQG